MNVKFDGTKFIAIVSLGTGSATNIAAEGIRMCSCNNCFDMWLKKRLNMANDKYIGNAYLCWFNVENSKPQGD